MDGYQCGAHTKYSMKVHLIFVVKYRKKILTDQIAEAVKLSLFGSTGELGCNIIQMETAVDHIHILLEYRPYLSISQIVKKLKQDSTNVLWSAHSSILRSCFWKHRVLWSKGYFACSIGQASQETIEAYIKNQG